ncbi:MAG: LytTR family DNA-binding domain-containing protein [Flavobacteriales bacterium]
MSNPRFPLILKAAQGWRFIEVRLIVSILAEDKFARIRYADGAELLVFHSLAELEAGLCCGVRLGDLLFLRPHRSCIVAMHHATAIHAKREVVMCDGTVLPLSKRIWPKLVELLGSIQVGQTALRSTH